MLDFISDFHQEYNLAKAVVCVYSDRILAFCLLAAPIFLKTMRICPNSNRFWRQEKEFNWINEGKFKEISKESFGFFRQQEWDWVELCVGDQDERCLGCTRIAKTKKTEKTIKQQSWGVKKNSTNYKRKKICWRTMVKH